MCVIASCNRNEIARLQCYVFVWAVQYRLQVHITGPFRTKYGSPSGVLPGLHVPKAHARVAANRVGPLEHTRGEAIIWCEGHGLLTSSCRTQSHARFELVGWLVGWLVGLHCSCMAVYIQLDR